MAYKTDKNISPDRAALAAQLLLQQQQPQQQPLPMGTLQDALAQMTPGAVSDYPIFGNQNAPTVSPASSISSTNAVEGPIDALMRRLAQPKEYERGKTEGPVHGPTIAPELQQTAAPNDGTLDAINALMQMAGNVPQPGEGGIDIEGIMKEAAGAARKPFQAQIQSTRGQNQRAKADTDYSSKQIRKMYRSLARSNKRAATRESDQATATATQINDMSQNSADQLAQQNQTRLNEAAAQAAALGSGDLAATLGADINANTSEATRQLAETANNASVATLGRGDAERRYLNRSGQNAKLTGTNRAADLYGDLQDYLQGNRDKINELRGQASAAAGQAKSAASASASQANSALYDQQYRAHQDMLDNQMALLGMKTGLQQQDFENNMSTQELMMRLAESQRPDPAEQPLVPGFDNRLIEALPDEQRSALMMQQFLNPESGDALSQLMQNPALRSGFYEDAAGNKIPIGGNPLNAEQLMAELGLSGSDPQQNFVLAQIIAQLASANTDLPYGAQR
jgi:hypothetical protein